MSSSSNNYGSKLVAAMEAAGNLSLNHYASLLGIGLTLLVLLVPLRNIDRRDQVAGFTYVLFCVAAGTMLTLALPMQLTQQSDVAKHATVVALFAVIAGVRWGWRPAAVMKQVKANAKESMK